MRHHAPTSRGTGHQEPLYDPNVATPSHAEHARTLVSRVGTGTLCTLAREPAGHPYGSFVTYGLQNSGDPVFLVSTLAEHTQNLLGDPRASLLVAEPGEGDPLARSRATLLGTCTRLARGQDTEARDAFLSVHRDAAYYADFADFAFWRLTVEAMRYIGGYGRMSWVEVDAWRAAEPDPIASSAAGILGHVNADHAEALVLMCRKMSRATDTTAAKMTAVDRYGFEMSATTAEGPRPIRLAWSAPVTTASDVRREMVEMVRSVRD
jgi:heme iron utilization protein